MVEYVAGIDYSYTTPAIAIHPLKPIKNFNDVLVFFYTSETKYMSSFNKNIHGMPHSPYESEIERFENIANWAMAILTKFKVKEVALEGYSMGSKGSTFTIGENTGLLKLKLWQNGIEYITPAPTTIKMHFAGKGNAKKVVMLEKFDERFDLDLKTILNYKRKNIESPIGDIVDCVAVVDYLINNK